MDNLAEGDVDLIKAPIVIDNVSDYQRHSPPDFLTIYFSGLWYHEGWSWWRVRAIARFQFIVSTTYQNRPPDYLSSQNVIEISL